MANTNINSSNVKVSKLVKDNPSNAALISKLNQENISTDFSQVAGKLESTLPNMVNDIKSKLINNEHIMALFPDMELIIQIITSSVLAPNDMVTTSIVYNAPDINLPISLKDSLKEVIAEHIETNYKLESNLTKILREALFTKGAYVEAIIPEAAVDEVINGVPDDMSGKISVESFNKDFKDKYINNSSLGIFASNEKDTKVSTESFDAKIKDLIDKTTTVSTENLFFDITDNIGIIIESELKKDMVPTSVKSKLNRYKRTSVSTEANATDKNKMEATELNNLFKLLQNTKDETTVFVNNNKGTFRKSIGKPMVIKFPVESIIPVHVINNPDKHLGYFGVLDENGSPIKMNEMMLENNDYTNFKTQESKYNLITKANTNLTSMTKKDIKMDNLEEVYNVILDKAIKDKLSNSVYNDMAELRDTGDIYRVMFTRALKAKKTRLIYLPKELVSYYSFEHRDNGTGKSMLEKTQMLFSIRSIVLFAKLMSFIKNSINVTKVTAQLDDDDTDPAGTMEKIISESLKTRQTLLPIGLNKIDELMDWGNKIGFRYNFKHPSLPNMELDISEENRSMSMPDDALEEEVKKILYMSFGLTPEIVDSGYSSDFATTVKSKNLLFAKRITQIQEIFLPQVTDNVRILIENDISLQEKLIKILKNNYKDTKKSLKKHIKANAESDENVIIEQLLDKEDAVVDYILNRFISEIYITIPSTEMVEAAAMKTAFDSYRQMLDDYMDYVIVTDSMPEELVGALGGKLDLLKGVLKNTLIRKWMTDNNYVPEFSDFITKDSEGEPVFNLLEEHNSFVESLSKTVSDFIIKNKEIKKTYNNNWKLATAEDIEEEETTTGDGSGYGSGEDDTTITNGEESSGLGEGGDLGDGTDPSLTKDPDLSETGLKEGDELGLDKLPEDNVEETEKATLEETPDKKEEEPKEVDLKETEVTPKKDDVTDSELTKEVDNSGKDINIDKKDTDMLEPDDEEEKVVPFEEDEENPDEIKKGEVIDEKVPDEENDNSKKSVNPKDKEEDDKDKTEEEKKKDEEEKNK